MARILIGTSIAAGNASNATVFTMPSGYEGFISSIIAYNSSGGSLNLTLTLTRGGVDNVILATDAVGSGATNFYAKGASKPLCPLVLTAATGDILKAQGSGSGITVTISGVRFST